MIVEPSPHEREMADRYAEAFVARGAQASYEDFAGYDYRQTVLEATLAEIVVARVCGGRWVGATGPDGGIDVWLGETSMQVKRNHWPYPRGELYARPDMTPTADLITLVCPGPGRASSVFRSSTALHIVGYCTLSEFRAWREPRDYKRGNVVLAVAPERLHPIEELAP